MPMRFVLSLMVVVAVVLSGCIPIGIRMGTQPDLGSANPFVVPADHT
jgi:hypothetical protein